MSVRRRWAWPLMPLYGGVLAVQEALRASGVPPERRLGWPVISVGSVSAGGAGKTPVVMALGRLLAERGWVVDVLSRGYGRAGAGVERVEVGLADAARRFGDEPVLMAERTGLPVWVGADRFAAGRAAERAAEAAEGWEARRAGAPVCAHLLDDGMQHRSVARQFELAVVTAEDLGDRLLPLGNLREPLPGLRRADAFAVREEELEQVTAWLRAKEMGAPVWTLRRGLRFPSPLGVFGAGLRPLAFCGLARPEGFAAMLTAAGCGVVDTAVFRDHHRYEEKDVAVLRRLARQVEASGLVTTEKDAVKLGGAMRAQLEREIGPLMVVRLETSFVYEAPVVRTLESRLRTGRAATERVGAGVR